MILYLLTLLTLLWSGMLLITCLLWLLFYTLDSETIDFLSSISFSLRSLSSSFFFYNLESFKSLKLIVSSSLDISKSLLENESERSTITDDFSFSDLSINELDYLGESNLLR